MRILFKAITLALLMSCGSSKTSTSLTSSKPNVLFIILDDLRPELGCYGNKEIITPNIDAIAANGVVFERAYCNIPVCGASRASILTGTRPTRTTFLDYRVWMSEERPGITTLPLLFKQNGYTTISDGKVAHFADDAIGSWDIDWRIEDSSVVGRDYVNPENITLANANKGIGPAYERAETTDDNIYRDGRIVAKTIADLRVVAANKEPFFITMGLQKPHLPFNAPKQYWDIYDPNKITQASYITKPKDAPNEAMHQFGEMRKYIGIPAEGALSPELVRTLKHGYYAATTYADAQVGKIMRELQRLDLDKNTIVVVIGDHGYNLNEHGMWAKHCNFNTSLNTPLIISVPSQNKAGKSKTVVEFIDIYPTLADLCGLDLPSHLEGRSLVNALKQPDKIDKEEIAVCRWYDGLTIIEWPYFFTEWWDGKSNNKVDMLYNHDIDPNETVNIANDPKNKELVARLNKKMHANKGKNYENPDAYK